MKLNWKNMVWDSIMFSSVYQQSVFIRFSCSLCQIGYFSVLVSLKSVQVGFRPERTDISIRLEHQVNVVGISLKVETLSQLSYKLKWPTVVRL